MLLNYFKFLKILHQFNLFKKKIHKNVCERKDTRNIAKFYSEKLIDLASIYTAAQE